jgi:hypothetical protein
MVSVQERLHLFHGHHAVVFAMHTAASRKPRLGSASKRKQRHDLRKAEQQQERDGYRPSHRRGCANIAHPRSSVQQPNAPVVGHFESTGCKPLYSGNGSGPSVWTIEDLATLMEPRSILDGLKMAS